MAIALTGGDDPAQLREYAFYQLAPRLKTIPDVYRVEVSGGDVREIEVIVRPEDLLAHGLSAADLADQIGQTSLLQPVGRVEGRRSAYQILIDNQARTVRQIENIQLDARRPDRPRQRRGRRAGAARGRRSVDRLRPEGGRGRQRLPAGRRQHGQHLAGRPRPDGRGRADAAARRPAQAGAAQHPGDLRLRPVVVRRGVRRQRAQRHRRRRRLQRADPAAVPAQLAGDADLRPRHSNDSGDHIPVPLLERRDAQPDVAGRPGRRHRTHHRRHGRRRGEHRAAPDAGQASPPTAPARGEGAGQTPSPAEVGVGTPTPWTRRRRRSPAPSSARR